MDNPKPSEELIIEAKTFFSNYKKDKIEIKEI